MSPGRRWVWVAFLAVVCACLPGETDPGAVIDDQSVEPTHQRSGDQGDAAHTDDHGATHADDRSSPEVGETHDDPLPAEGSPEVRTCWTADAHGIGGEILLTDATEALGLVEPLTGMLGHAFAAGDVNGDGWQDLFVGTFADRPQETYMQRGASGPSPDLLLTGGPDGFVVDESFPSSRERTSGAVMADLTGDGHLNLVAARNPRGDGRGAGPTLAYHNDGNTLTDAVTLLPDTGARAVAVLDVEGNGRLDLFVAEDRWSGGSSVLLRNDGDLRFTDVTTQVGLPDDVHGLGVGAADLTGNGLADLFVAGSNRLFVNQGDGTFREADAEVFGWEIHGNEDDVAGIAIADMNRNGRLDIVLGQHFNSTLDLDEQVPIRLYLNEGVDAAGDPVFRDVTDEAGLSGLPTKAPHVEIADLDNDGWPDIITSASAGHGTLPAVFRHEGVTDGLPRFSSPEGLGDDQYWVTGGAIDLTRDGRLDVVLVEWLPQKPTRLWTNTGPAGSWLQIEVPPDAFGARVEVFEPGGLDNPDAIVGVREVIASIGYAAGGPPLVHIGLGELTTVGVRVTLPDGRGAALREVAANRHLAVGVPCR